MHEQTDNTIRKRMVEGIKGGLYEIKQEMHGNTDKVTNSLPLRKLDKIANRLIREFQGYDTFEDFLCKRGGYNVLLLYNKEDKTIYSFMSDKRFAALLKRKNIKKLHYIDALLEYNTDFQPERAQLSIFDDVLNKDEEKLRELKTEITTLLHNDEPKKYITVCHTIDGFRLCNVKAVVTSKYLEVLDEKDWSEFIDIDYSESIFNDAPKNVLDGEVKVALKSKLPTPPVKPDDLEIPVKEEKETSLS